MNKTNQRDYLHESVRTVRCGCCGSYITETWDYQRKCWTTTHVCTWRHRADLPSQGEKQGNQ